MLRQSFCHLRGIGPVKERRLWEAGLRCWDDLAGDDGGTGVSPVKGKSMVSSRQRVALREQLGLSSARLTLEDAGFFSRALPGGEQWRLLPDFLHSVAYLDIETTGGLGGVDHITTIVLYDGRSVRHYVHGDNLHQFPGDIADYRLLVTFNGKCFDVPMIEQAFGIKLHHGHIDLRFVLRRLGYRGGLKSCEHQLGLDRGNLEGVDGYFAVLLWREYQQTGDARALETLLAYNAEDVLNLQTLATLAYNAHLERTPFAEQLRLVEVQPLANPFEADVETVRRLRREVQVYL